MDQPPDESTITATSSPAPEQPPPPTTTPTGIITRIVNNIRIIIMAYINFFRRIITIFRTSSNILNALLRSLPTVGKTLLLTSIIALILSISTSTYLFLYTAIVHAGTWTMEYPVHFDYHFPFMYSCSGSTTNTLSSNQECINPQKYVPPTANIELGSQHTQWNAYDNSVLPPKSRAIKPVLKPKNPHFLHVALALPSTEVNHDLGVFMVEVILHHSPSPSLVYKSDVPTDDDNNDNSTQSKDIKSTILATSSRPAMLPHQSQFVDTIRTGLSMGPLVVGAWGEERTVVIESFDWFVENKSTPLTHVEIRLHTPPTYAKTLNTSYSPPHKPIHITQARLSIGRELNILQYTMKTHFYKSAIVGMGFLSLAQVLLACSIWFYLYHVNTNANEEDGEEEEEEEDVQESNAIVSSDDSYEGVGDGDVLAATNDASLMTYGEAGAGSPNETSVRD